MNNKYWAYNTSIIAKNLELPFLIHTNNDTANPISISKEKCPLTLQLPALKTKPFTTYNKNEYLYRLPEVANFYVKQGREIVIEPTGKNWNLIYFYLYKFMIPVALIQREQFIFDASGVWLNDKEVVLFFGNKKGKSTIVSRLHDNGYNIFTDYGCRLSIDNNKVTAYPSYPILDLWEDAFDAQKTFKKKQIIAPNIHRYQINISNSFINKKAVVKHIYALKRSPNTQTFSTPISSSELMMRLGHSFILNTLANNNLDKKKLFNFLTKATLNTKKSILFKQDNNITDLINLITKELKTHE